MIYDLLDGDKAYAAKMYHTVPHAPVVDRAAYLLSMAKNRCVLDIGASGYMSEAIAKVAGEYHSMNITSAEYEIDLDNANGLPVIPGVEIVIAGEVIEHLSNAGRFLDMLHVYPCPVILTTPNAFSEAARRKILEGIEAVNPEHVAWYSWYTLTNLVHRHGYNIISWYWYNGKPGTAEGLIFRMEGNDA